MAGRLPHPQPGQLLSSLEPVGSTGGTHGAAGRGRDRAVEPSSPAQVPSPHLTAHLGHRPLPTGVLGRAVGGLTQPEAHAAAPQPAPCCCLHAALACLNVPGGHELLAVLGGGRGGSQQQASALSSPRGTAFWRPLGVAGADGGLSASFLIGCTARGLAQDTRACSSAIPCPSSTSLLGSLSCLAQGTARHSPTGLREARAILPRSCLTFHQTPQVPLETPTPPYTVTS